MATRPTYFYYKNVACAPKGILAEISKLLYDTEPDSMGSKFIYAKARKRGYIHNMPCQNWSLLDLLSGKTIYEAFPHNKDR